MLSLSKDEGSTRAPIVLVGEAYGHWEDIYSRPFVGPSWNDKLKPWTEEVGLKREDFYITNTWDQGQPNSIGAISEHDMRASMDRLHERLARLEGPDGGGPLVIVTTGNYATYAVTGNGRVSFHSKDGRYDRPGIQDWRGSILQYTDRRGRNIKVIPTPHPAFTFRQPQWNWVLQADWKRIAEDAKFRELRLPNPTRMIAPSRAEAIEWMRWTRAEAAKRAHLAKYTGRLACSLDVETPKKEIYDIIQKESTAQTAKCVNCGHTKKMHVGEVEEVEEGDEGDAVPTPSAIVRCTKKALKRDGGAQCECCSFEGPKGKPRRILVSDDAYLGCIGYCWDPRLTLTIPTTIEFWQDPKDWALVRAEMIAFHDDPNIDFGGQNFGFDAWWCAVEGMPIRNMAWDLMKMHRVERPWSEWHDLAFQASIDTRQPFWKHESKMPDEISRWSHNKEQLWLYNCLSDTSQVLTSTFETKLLKDVQIGDQLLAPDENGGAQRRREVSRRWRVARVTEKKTSRRMCIRLMLKSGRYLELTPDHRILVDKGSNGKRWIEAGRLKIGALVVSGLMPVNDIDDIDRGWFGGFVDGEGTIHGISMAEEQRGKAGLGALSYAQKPGAVLDRADSIVRALGFKCSRKCPIGSSGSAVATYVLGGTQSSLSILSAIPSIRLREAMINLIERNDIHATGLYLDSVVGIQEGVERDVVDITTTTGTFVANGVVVHNCTDNFVQRSLLDIRLAGLIEAGRDEYYEEMEAPIDPGLVEMSLWGLRADEKGRAEEFEKLTVEANSVSKELNDAAGVAIVKVDKHGAIVGKQPSTKKLGVFFYETLRLPVQYKRDPKTKKKRVSTDVVTIKRLCEQFPGLDQLQRVGANTLRRRRLTTLLNYLKAERLKNGRQYAIFKQDTLLGRLSSSKTPKHEGANLQNVDRKLRKYYIADTGEETLPPL